MDYQLKRLERQKRVILNIDAQLMVMMDEYIDGRDVKIIVDIEKNREITITLLNEIIKSRKLTVSDKNTKIISKNYLKIYNDVKKSYMMDEDDDENEQFINLFFANIEYMDYQPLYLINAICDDE